MSKLAAIFVAAARGVAALLKASVADSALEISSSLDGHVGLYFGGGVLTASFALEARGIQFIRSPWARITEQPKVRTLFLRERRGMHCFPGHCC